MAPLGLIRLNDQRNFPDPLVLDVHKMVTRTITILQHMQQNCYCACDHFLDIRTYQEVHLPFVHVRHILLFDHTMV